MGTRHLLPACSLIAFSSITLLAAGLAVTVHDPSGASVQGATVAIQASMGGPARTLTTDAAGTAASNDLANGEYKVQADKPGFEHAERVVTLAGNAVTSLVIDLKIAVQESTIHVGGKISSLANSNPDYVALRTTRPSVAMQVTDLVLQRDAATFTFRSGTFTFGNPVLGKTVYAVFNGEATFHLKPAMSLESNYLKFISGAEETDEVFNSAVFCFTDSTADDIRAAATAGTASGDANHTWQEFRDGVRKHPENARSLVESVLGDENAPNLDADLLASLYAPSQKIFLAYIHGRKHDDLRFVENPAGALPALRSPEEVALINVDPNGERDGIWYMSHLVSEWDRKSASSNEDHRPAKAGSFRIDTAIGSNTHLAGSALVHLKALTEGTRVLKFGLLPALRVSSVRLGNTEIPYIQEARQLDGSFYVILPEGLKAGAETELSISYEGDKVVRDEGGGNFSVSARESWYPSMNSFADRATYDLTFRVPKAYTLVSVGKLDKSSVEQDYAVTHWVSDVPIPVAGFNYGEFRKYSKTDEPTNYLLEAYATRDVPAYMRTGALALSPTAMAERTLVDAQNSVRLFEHWFGALPYGRLAITQQPQFNFGQSWPTLVYLPVSAFLDETQRWMLLRGQAFRFAEFINEVTPHEVSHQWWGHAVGWASYRDQWLSEGFATFSAGLLLQLEGKENEYRQYWETERKRLVEKNAFGIRPGEALPLWMGLRLETFHTPRGYSQITYAKGAYVLHMLRSLMWDPKTQDTDFIEMMKDFVKSNFNQNPSTESFRFVAEKHIKPQMDLTGDHKLLWFFSQWVYGTSIPKYQFEYSLKDEPDGKVLLTGKLTQSNVTDAFRMTVPIYAEFDNKQYVRLGSTFMAGNQTGKEFSIRLPKRPKKVMANQFDDVLAIDTVNQQVN